MPGLRIHHRTVINRIFTIVDKARPYSSPFECPTCHLTHVFKTYHINVDGEGSAIVSPEVWRHVQRLEGHGFELMNEVSSPPPIRIAVGFAGNAHIVDQHGKEIERGE